MKSKCFAGHRQFIVVTKNFNSPIIPSNNKEMLPKKKKIEPSDVRIAEYISEKSQSRRGIP